jgi:hypothetical protein
MSKYTAGQAVEVLAYDFTVAGFPQVWMPATITDIEVNPETGISYLSITRTDGAYAHQLVGKRGGNKNLRAA